MFSFTLLVYSDKNYSDKKGLLRMSKLDRKRLRSAWVLTGTVALCFTLAACSSTSAKPTSTRSSSSSKTTSTNAGASSSSSPAKIATIPPSDTSPPGTFGTEPTVTVPPGPAPTQLESADLIVGSGASATDGKTVTVQYVGVSYSSKKVFDASWTSGQPFTFTLGAGQVIPGWDEGVVGMKVGGRRELIIPPNLAYGSQSPSPAISANDTLIFVIDLLKVS